MPTKPRIVTETSPLVQPFRRSDEVDHSTTHGPRKLRLVFLPTTASSSDSQFHRNRRQIRPPRRPDESFLDSTSCCYRTAKICEKLKHCAKHGERQEMWTRRARSSTRLPRPSCMSRSIPTVLVPGLASAVAHAKIQRDVSSVASRRTGTRRIFCIACFECWSIPKGNSLCRLFLNSPMVVPLKHGWT